MGSLGVFGVSGIGGTGAFVGDRFGVLHLPRGSSTGSFSREGSFRIESFLVIVPEEWIMLASSSFMMKLTVFFFFRSLSFRWFRRSVAVSFQLDSEPL